MWVQTPDNGFIWVDRVGRDQEWTTSRMEWFAPSDIIFDLQHMYISRRGDTVGPPVWKSTILHVFLKSECQRHMLHPPHCHMLTPTGYPTALFCTQYPSNVERDSISRLPHDCHTWLTNTAYHH